mgnify:CR=1 FL=1
MMTKYSILYFTFIILQITPRGDSHVERMGVLVTPFRVKKEVLVPLRVFRLKSSIVEALGVSFWVLSQIIVTGDI